MKIRNLLSPFILAMAIVGASLAQADTVTAPVSPVDAAYNEYQREANELETILGRYREPIVDRPELSVLSPAFVKGIEMHITYQKAKHDLALGKYLAATAAAGIRKE